METTTLSSSTVGLNCGVLNSSSSKEQRNPLFLLLSLPKTTRRASVLRCSPQGHDVLQMFLKERQQNGDLVSKVSDLLWVKDYVNIVDSEDTISDGSDIESESGRSGSRRQLQQVQVMEREDEGGLLKLTKAYEWVLGDEIAPVNKKAVLKEFQNNSDQRKRLNFLQYEAIKREMMSLTIGIGTVCSGFCLVAFSFQAAISYAVGVLLSCLYLQLLYFQVDNLSRESVPSIFMQKKTKKIGIRSGDISNQLERVVRGMGFVLSSPRLIMPAVIYGFWELSNYFSSDFLSFQLVPAMFGLFAYKAAALVQVYRDNEDLLIVFPESWESSN